MAVSDAARNRLYNTIREHYGTDDADTMMELLPPIGWSDVARQSDINRLELRMDRLDGEVRALGNRFVTWLIGFGAVQTAVVGLLVGLR